MKIFRSIRQKFIKKGNTSSYLKYAIGEIVLVVIGILIALQINTWQQGAKEKTLETRYLKNLSLELQKDSTELAVNYTKLNEQAVSKNRLLDLLKLGKKHDSLKELFNLQWRPIYPYTPLKSTYEEITNSSHLNIIRSDELRSEIVKLYNGYEDLEKDEDFLLQYFSKLVEALSENIPDIYSPTVEDILEVGKKPHIQNGIRLNGAYTRRNNYKEKLDQCTGLLKMIRDYQNKK